MNRFAAWSRKSRSALPYLPGERTVNLTAVDRQAFPVPRTPGRKMRRNRQDRKLRPGAAINRRRFRRTFRPIIIRVKGAMHDNSREGAR